MWLKDHLRVIEQLVNDQLYTPSGIVDLAETLGIWDGMSPTEKRKKRRVWRNNLGKKAREVLGDPDGHLPVKGPGGLHPAYFGHRWKKAAGLVEE